HNSSSSSNPALIIDLHRDLVHRGVGVWGLLLGVPSGHRVDLELSQQELTNRDHSRPQWDHQDPWHRLPEHSLDQLLKGEDQI
ncbi:hypothetical protein KI387_021375, partial [Taxus chinensis]